MILEIQRSTQHYFLNLLNKKDNSLRKLTLFFLLFPAFSSSRNSSTSSLQAHTPPNPLFLPKLLPGRPLSPLTTAEADPIESPKTLVEILSFLFGHNLVTSPLNTHNQIGQAEEIGSGGSGDLQLLL